MNIVERVENLCKSQSTTIKAVERELELSNGCIKKWNTSSPSVDRVQRVAQKFNVSIDWLVTGCDTNNLTFNEKKLVELYRETSEIGQPLIMKNAENIQSALPQCNPNTNLLQESSTFKIG